MTSASVSPGTPTRRIEAGILAISSGVRPSGSGSSAGSPSGSEPSGSSRAARWPCVRCALISDIAAWTACSSSRFGSAEVAGAGSVFVSGAATAVDACGVGAVGAVPISAPRSEKTCS